jgi:hypothetical protein
VKRTLRALVARPVVVYAVLALAAVPVGRGLSLPWRLVAVIAVSLAIMAIRESLLSVRRLQARRRASDLWLESSRGGLIPAEHAWRAAELVSPRERHILARGLRNAVRATKNRSPITAALVSRRLLAPHEREVETLADRLDDMSKPVSPAGIIAVEKLLVEPDSPLYFGPENLGDTLSRIWSKLPDAASSDDGHSRRAA